MINKIGPSIDPWGTRKVFPERSLCISFSAESLNPYAFKLTLAVEECLPCQAVTNKRQQEPLKMWELPNGPWEHFQDGVFRSLSSKKYVLVVQSLYSCFSAVEIVTSTSALAITPAMGKIKNLKTLPNRWGPNILE